MFSYNHLFSEDVEQTLPPIKKLKKHKLYPYVHENEFNYYNKNNIKMKKTKTIFEKEIVSQNLGEQLPFKYSKAQMVKIFNRETEEIPYKSNLKLEHEPIFFLTNNVQNQTECTTDPNYNFYIKEENEDNKSNYYFGDLLNYVDDFKIEDTEKNAKEKAKLESSNCFHNIESNKIFHSYSKKECCRHNKNSYHDLTFSPKKNWQSSGIDVINTSIVLTKADKEHHISRSPDGNSIGLNKSNRHKLFLKYSGSEVKNNLKIKSLDEEYKDYKKMIINPKNLINKISTFGMKLNSELSKVSGNYGKLENHVRFGENPLVNELFINAPKFEIYKNFKMLEDKKSHKYKFKLAPLGGRHRGIRLDDFSNKFFHKN